MGFFSVRATQKLNCYQTGILRDLFHKGYLYISKLIELYVRPTINYIPLVQNLCRMWSNFSGKSFEERKQEIFIFNPNLIFEPFKANSDWANLSRSSAARRS